MLSSTARSSPAPAVRLSYTGTSRRPIRLFSSNWVLQGPSSKPRGPTVSQASEPGNYKPIIIQRPFSATHNAYSTRRARRVHREAISAVNASLTGRIPAFTGSPPTATPAALRLAAKARLARTGTVAPNKPPTFLDYEPQKNKPSSVFFWSDEANEMDKRLVARGDYPPPLPKFKHNENQQIAKCHPSVWIASAHHIQMMHEGYDRLAFMGDAVAGKCMSDLLLNEYYCIAGVMGALKSRLVSNAQFAYFSRIYNIPCKSNENAQGDAFEALVGALYLDGKRDGTDVDRIIYNWLKELFEPWLELYVNQLPPSSRERVVSLHRAVPIGIAVATSDSPNSSQVMMAWESNIATQMIEKRGKSIPQVEKGLLQGLSSNKLGTLVGPTVDAVGTSSAAPGTNELWSGSLAYTEEVEAIKLKEDAPSTEVEGRAKIQDSAEAPGKIWPTTKIISQHPLSEKQEVQSKLEADIRAESDALRKANEERRQREEDRRKEAEQIQKNLEAERQRRMEEEKRKAEEQARLAVLKQAERIRMQLEIAKKEANEARRKADEDAEMKRKKLEELRPKTKAEKRAEKKAARLEAEMAIWEAKRRKLEQQASATKAAAEKAEAERAEAERAEAGKEQAKRAKEAAENERAEKERAEKEKAEKEKVEKERVEKEQTEKSDKAKAEREKAEKEKADKKKAEKEKEKAEKEKAEKEKAEKEKAEKEKAEKEKEEKEKAEKEKEEKEKKEKEKKEAEKKEKSDKDAATKKSTGKAEEKSAYSPSVHSVYSPPSQKLQPIQTVYTPPSPKPGPVRTQDEKVAALIKQKEAEHAAKLAKEEVQLKFERLVYDIEKMEALVMKRRDEMIRQQPNMTSEQKEQFRLGWQQYADVQREKMEKDAGYEPGVTKKVISEVKEPEESEAPKAEEEHKEEKGLFGRLWGALSGRK